MVILGGTSGISLATARVLAEAGANVIIAGRSPEKLAQARDSLSQSVTGEVVDATSREQTHTFFRRIGPFDHLVLTLAGNEGAGEFRTPDFAMLYRAFEAKFWPQLIAAQTSLDTLRKDGSLTMVSAVTAQTAYAGASGLGAVNGALEGMIRTLALELQPLCVNAVAPRTIATPWWKSLPDESREAVFTQTAARTPVKRVGRPEDPTGCATRLLLGAPRLLDHSRSPHANKQWWIMAFRLQHFDSAWGCRRREQGSPH